ADRNRSHWSTSKTPSYTKSVSWQHHRALAGQKAKRGVFITTSGFTSQARDFAQSVEGMVLVDGERLVHLMIENEVGVSSRLLKVPKLDMDYFE
ncbi:restriction endonuclease, partial [Escherichia coli]|uniref:restriction endonuclease n=1 Tax=Escherichia coli TaxID=562 RepID=UPI002271AF79